MINNCVHDIKYAVVGKNGSLEWKNQVGLKHAANVCLMASSEDDMNVIMDKVNECVIWLDGE